MSTDGCLSHMFLHDHCAIKYMQVPDHYVAPPPPFPGRHARPPSATAGHQQTPVCWVSYVFLYGHCAHNFPFCARFSYSSSTPLPFPPPHPTPQARKATLGNSRASTDAGPGRQPGTPRGGGMTNRRGGPGGGGGFFPANPSLGSLGGGSMGGFDGGMNQGGRNSFDAAGYGSGMGGGWSRGPGNVLGGSVPGGLGGGYGGGISSSLGALGGTPPGMHSAAAAMGQGRALRSSFEYGMGGLGGPSALQMLQGAGGTAGYPAGLAPGFDVSTAGNLDQQLQLLMQMTGTGGDPTGAFGALPGGLLGGIPGGQPGTPPPAGGLRGNPLVPGNAGGLFGPPMSAAAAGGPLGALAGLSTPPGAFMSAQGGNPALFGGNPAGAPGGGMFSPSGLPGMGGGFMGGSAGGMAGFGEGAGGHMGGGGQQRQVLVTRLPPGLNEANLRALFEICGPLGAVSKKPEQVRPKLGLDGEHEVDCSPVVCSTVVCSLQSDCHLDCRTSTLIAVLSPRLQYCHL